MGRSKKKKGKSHAIKYGPLNDVFDGDVSHDRDDLDEETRCLRRYSWSQLWVNVASGRMFEEKYEPNSSINRIAGRQECHIKQASSVA